MIQLILSFFGLGSKLSKLQKKSSDALGAFNKTLHDMRDVNTAITSHHTKLNKQILKMRDEQNTLMEQFDNNIKVISKIEEFLS